MPFRPFPHRKIAVEPFEVVAYAAQFRADADEKRSDLDLHAAGAKQ